MREHAWWGGLQPATVFPIWPRSGRFPYRRSSALIGGQKYFPRVSAVNISAIRPLANSRGHAGYLCPLCDPTRGRRVTRKPRTRPTFPLSSQRLSVSAVNISAIRPLANSRGHAGYLCPLCDPTRGRRVTRKPRTSPTFPLSSQRLSVSAVNISAIRPLPTARWHAGYLCPLCDPTRGRCVARKLRTRPTFPLSSQRLRVSAVNISAIRPLPIARGHAGYLCPLCDPTRGRCVARKPRTRPTFPLPSLRLSVSAVNISAIRPLAIARRHAGYLCPLCDPTRGRRVTRKPRTSPTFPLSSQRLSVSAVNSYAR
jgi:hypothetical protein